MNRTRTHSAHAMLRAGGARTPGWVTFREIAFDPRQRLLGLPAGLKHLGEREAIRWREFGRLGERHIGVDIALPGVDRAQDLGRASFDIHRIRRAIAEAGGGRANSVETLAHAALERREAALVEHLHHVALEPIAETVRVAVHPSDEPV
jgi:hypothetical protein